MLQKTFKIGVLAIILLLNVSVYSNELDDREDDYLFDEYYDFASFESREEFTEIGELEGETITRGFSFPALTMPPNIDSHRPEVYTNGFPTISIDMDVPINWSLPHTLLQDFRNSWHGATLNVSNTSPSFEMESVRVTARGRGNSTWLAMGEKRPIRFRFPNNQWRAMFDSPHVGRDWVTFANAADPSHLRNFSAYYLGQSLGTFNFTPQTWFAHLYLDGDYRGVYMLLDEREAIEGRGDLTLDTDPTISEYMIEFDARTMNGESPVNTHWVNVRGSWDIRYPSTSAWMSEENNSHALYVDDFLTRLDNSILSGDRETIEQMIDIDTFVDFYLVHEFVRNQDSRWSSLFFQIRGQGDERRLHAGPIWDFDLTAGGATHAYSPIGSTIVNRSNGNYRFDWYFYLMNMPWFREVVRERWSEIRNNEINQMMNRISYMALKFESEFDRDFKRWPNTVSQWITPTVSDLTTPLEQTEFLHWWFSQRIKWIDYFLDMQEEMPSTWEVTVNGGSGSGVFRSGMVVSIRATTPPGQRFVRWEGSPMVSFSDVHAENTTFMVPPSDVMVQAIFEPHPETCLPITEDRFTGQRNGLAGSRWRLCEDGTLEIDPGFINWNSTTSPWHAQQAIINRIVITGEVTAGSSLRSLFNELTNVTEIEGLAYFNTSRVTDMSRMFRGTSSLTSIDLSGFDTANVVDMSWMFRGASSLTSLDLSGFDTANVTNMSLMFRETEGLLELDISGFNTGNVTDMREMFRASGIRHLNLSSFNTISIVNMNLMFTGTTSLSELTLGESFRFIGSAGLPGVRQTAEFTGRWQNVGTGTAENPTGAIVLTSTQLMTQFTGQEMADVFVWQPVNRPVVGCPAMATGRFANQVGAAGLAGSQWRLCEGGTLEIDSGFINWNSTNSPWHAHQENITHIVITGEITAGLSLRSLFNELTGVIEIEGLTYFDTTNVTNMSRMFRGVGVTSLDLSGFDTTNVVDMSWMFRGASNLTHLDLNLPRFDTANVVDMSLMFRDTESLLELDISSFNTGNVTDMREMFRASGIRRLNLSNFDVSSIVNMNLMFTGTTSLSELALGESFRFIGSAGLPGVRQTAEFTGRWQNVGTGTAENPTGAIVLTSTQLMTQFTGQEMADIFVWQPIR